MHNPVYSTTSGGRRRTLPATPFSSDEIYENPDMDVLPECKFGKYNLIVIIEF